MQLTVEYFTNWVRSLPAKTSLDGAEELVLSDGGSARKITADLLGGGGLVPHADSHAEDGTDELTPAMIGALPVDGGTLQRYWETGGVLVPSAGVLTIPLDGLVYGVLITNPISEIVTEVPLGAAVGSSLVYFLQEPGGGHAVTLPEDWYWDEGEALPIATGDRAATRLVLMSDILGNVHADLSYRQQAGGSSSSL